MVLENLLENVFGPPAGPHKSLERRLKNTKIATYLSFGSSLILTAAYGANSENFVPDQFQMYLRSIVLTLAYVASIGLTLQWCYLSWLKNRQAIMPGKLNS